MLIDELDCDSKEKTKGDDDCLDDLLVYVMMKLETMQRNIRYIYLSCPFVVFT